MQSKWKDFFWPIRREELIKVLPMALMMFCFLFNYTIMRDLKDTLILCSSGAEAICTAPHLASAFLRRLDIGF